MIYLLLGILGLALGSFVNALVFRLHEQSKSPKSKVQSPKYSILSGRSMCVNCKHALAWYDLIPVFSWLLLHGKCRYCHKPISAQYPLVELLTALLFVFSYQFWPINSAFQGWSLETVAFGLWLVLLTGLISLAVYDYKWMLLPNRMVFPLQAVALAYVLTRFIGSGGDWQVLLGAIAGVVCSAGLFYVLYQLSSGKWIGGGDVKLAVVLGLVLGGAYEALLMLFIASAVGSLIGIPMLFAGKSKLQTKLPFGPLLILATFAVVLFGSSIIGWYTDQFLII